MTSDPFPLRYFEDAVSKGTYELLPGCASIVLERVASIQAFVNGAVAGGEDLDSAMQGMYAAVAALTQWADSVILSGGFMVKYVYCLFGWSTFDDHT